MKVSGSSGPVPSNTDWIELVDAGDGKLVIKLKGLPWKADEDDVKNFLSGVDLVMDDGIVIVESGT